MTMNYRTRFLMNVIDYLDEQCRLLTSNKLQAGSSDPANTVSLFLFSLYGQTHKLFDLLPRTLPTNTERLNIHKQVDWFQWTVLTDGEGDQTYLGCFLYDDVLDIHVLVPSDKNYLGELLQFNVRDKTVSSMLSYELKLAGGKPFTPRGHWIISADKLNAPKHQSIMRYMQDFVQVETKLLNLSELLPRSE